MFYHRRANTKTLPRPVVLSPSGTFDGDDGKWSTFTINVAGDGDGKGQDFKVLISTSSPITLVPAQTSWCNTDDCAKRRGIETLNSFGLDDTPSNTYSKSGLYNLPLEILYYWSRDLLLPGGNGTLGGEWGVTNVGLGRASKQSTTIAKQYVATSYLKDFFLGSLGLTVGSISPQGAELPTYFSGLTASKDADGNDVVPSISYGFTAGASYRKCNSAICSNLLAITRGLQTRVSTRLLKSSNMY
jgi:hypothetical protein